MAFGYKSKSGFVLLVFCAFFFFGVEADIIECEDEKVTKTIKPSKTGIAHASFCAEIRPPPEPYAELPLANDFCFTHHLCAEHYFWWWEATKHEQDIYTIHVQIRGLDKQDKGEFPVTIFTNRYQEALNFTVVVSDKGDDSEDDPEAAKDMAKIEECADMEAKADVSGSSQKCPSGWVPVGDGLCLLGKLGDPVNFPLAKESCATYGATLVKMEKTEEEVSKRRRRDIEKEDEDKEEDEETGEEDEEEDEDYDYDDDLEEFESDDPEKDKDSDEDEESDDRKESTEDKSDGKKESERYDEEKEKDEKEIENGDGDGDEEGDEKGDVDKDEEVDKSVDEEGDEESIKKEGEDESVDKEGDDEKDDDESLDDGAKEVDMSETDVEELRTAESEKEQEEQAKDKEKKYTHIKRMYLGIEKDDNYVIDKCLNARLATLTESQDIWVWDEEDDMSCLTYNTETKLIREERTCHFLYHKFTCLFDTKKYKKPYITDFHVQFHYHQGHHKDVDLSVTKRKTAYHEVKAGMTHAIISCKADGWPKPDVVIVEEAMSAQPQTLHESPHQHNISGFGGGALLGRFSCVASNIFGDQAEIGDLQLWRYEAPYRVKMLTSGLMILLLLIMVVAIIIVMNRFKFFKSLGRCHTYLCSCNCPFLSRRRPTGASRVPTEIFPPSQDYVYGDVWADEVPLYVRQARVRTSSNSGPVYKKCTEEK